MLSKVSSLVGGAEVFSVLPQAATSAVFQSLQGLAKALSQGGDRLGVLISNPTAKAKGQQEIDVLLNLTANQAANTLKGVFTLSLSGSSTQRGSGEALTDLKTDLQRLGLPSDDPLKMDMAAFLKKHVER